MADPQLDYDPTDGWLNETTFPTTPTSEAASRTLFQRLFTQVKTFINVDLVDWINATFATIDTVQGIALGTISDDTVTDAKLKDDTGTVKRRVNTYLTTGGVPDTLLSDTAGQLKDLSTTHFASYIKHGLIGTTTGTSTAYTITPNPALTAYSADLYFQLNFDKTNTGSSTLNVSSLGTKIIKKYVAAGKVTLTAGDIIAGGIYELIYDGTDLILLNPTAVSSSLLTAQGSMVVASSANTPVELALGATGKVLQSNGTTVGYDYASSSEYTPSDTVLLTANTERTTTSSTFANKKVFKVNKAGLFRVKGQINDASAGGVVARITDRSGIVISSQAVSSTSSYAAFSLDTIIPVAAGEYIYVQLRNDDNVSTVYIKDVTVCGDVQLCSDAVITD